MKAHTTIRAFGTMDGQLAVGKFPLELLAERVGSTPFFAYDRRLLTERVRQLRDALPTEVQIGYAVKANPMPAVVQHLASMVDALDVASALEMRTALDTTIPPAQVSFAGPGKTPQEIRQAVAAGVTIEVESLTESRRVVEAGNRLGVRPRVAIRVNPDFVFRGSGMRLGGGPQQFGVDAEQVPSLLYELAAEDLEFQGFHVFAGSQNLSAEIICASQRKTVDLLLALADKTPWPVRYLNLGGGFGTPYFDKDEPLDLLAVGQNIADLVERLISPNLPDASTVIELGRYIVGECGVYVTRVVDRKESRGHVYLVVDGGLHHQLAASGNFGQVIRRNYPVLVGNRITEPPSETVSIVGCLCTPLDVLGHQVHLPHATVGDLVVLFHAGAYGLTASPTDFLSHPRPAEVLV